MRMLKTMLGIADTCRRSKQGDYRCCRASARAEESSVRSLEVSRMARQRKTTARIISNLL